MRDGIRLAVFWSSAPCSSFFWSSCP
jgi:hypothetical protein